MAQFPNIHFNLLHRFIIPADTRNYFLPGRRRRSYCHLLSVESSRQSTSLSATKQVLFWIHAC